MIYADLAQSMLVTATRQQYSLKMKVAMLVACSFC